MLASIWQNSEGIYAHKSALFLFWLSVYGVLFSVLCTAGLLVLLELTHGAFLCD